MRTAWTRVSILLAGSLLAFLAALWMLRIAVVQARLPQMVETTRQAFQAHGGAQGLEDRHRLLSEIRQRLELERLAKSSDAELFNRRLGEVFVELGLAVTTTSGWRSLPGFEGGRAAGFERTITGAGTFAALLDAIRTIESWPDRARVRSLRIAPQGPGSIFFTLEIAVVRLRPTAENEES
jgi:hypothetical protein